MDALEILWTTRKILVNVGILESELKCQVIRQVLLLEKLSRRGAGVHHFHPLHTVCMPRTDWRREMGGPGAEVNYDGNSRLLTLFGPD